MRPHPVFNVGGILGLGLGGFHFVEGLANRQIFGSHHGLHGSPHQMAADVALLASGVLFFLVGCALTPTVEGRYYLAAT